MEVPPGDIAVLLNGKLFTTCSFWTTHARVARGKEKTNDTDGIVDPNYQEALRTEGEHIQNMKESLWHLLVLPCSVIMVSKEQS